MNNETGQKDSQVHILPYFFGSVEMQFCHVFNLAGLFLAFTHKNGATKQGNMWNGWKYCSAESLINLYQCFPPINHVTPSHQGALSPLPWINGVGCPDATREAATPAPKAAAGLSTGPSEKLHLI